MKQKTKEGNICVHWKLFVSLGKTSGQQWWLQTEHGGTVQSLSTRGLLWHLSFFEGLQRKHNDIISECSCEAAFSLPPVSQYWKVGMKWMSKAYSCCWHEGHHEHKASGSQVAERINTQFAHTKRTFPWQGKLNYTQGKFHMPLEKK